MADRRRKDFEALGLATSKLDVAKDMQRLQDMVMPRGLRQMVDMQKSVAEYTRPYSFAADVLKGAAAHSEMITKSGLAESAFATAIWNDSLATKLGLSSDLLEQRHRFDELAGVNKTWASMMKAAEAFEVANTLGREIRRMKRLNGLLGGHLDLASHTAWSKHLKALPLPAAAFLGHEWPRPTGLLAEVVRPASGASVSWLGRRGGEPAVVTTSLVAERVEAPSTLDVDVEVQCSICGHPMLGVAGSGHLRLVGPRRGILRLRVFPMCPECQDQEQDEPGFLLKALRRQERPQLYAIRGQGQGDGISRGHLSLVPVGDDDEAGE